jgi:predicted oxidoreductase
MFSTLIDEMEEAAPEAVKLMRKSCAFKIVTNDVKINVIKNNAEFLVDGGGVLDIIQVFQIFSILFNGFLPSFLSISSDQ